MMVTPAGEPTLDMATYSWPWEKHGFGRKMPSRSKVFPCALLTVMAKAAHTGNWRRVRVKGEGLLEGCRLQRGMKGGGGGGEPRFNSRRRHDEVVAQALHDQARAVGEELAGLMLRSSMMGNAWLEAPCCDRM